MKGEICTGNNNLRAKEINWDEELERGVKK